MDCDIGLVIQARMGSTRLPNKVLLDLCGKPLLSYIIKGLTSLKKEYKIIVITSNLQKDNVIWYSITESTATDQALKP